MRTPKIKIFIFTAALGLGTLSSCKCSKTTISNQEEVGFQIPINDFANSYSWAPSFDSKTQTFWITVKLKDGVHAYSEGEKIGRPVDIEILDFNNWQLVGKPILPQGIKKTFGGSGNSYVLENSFKLGAKVKDGNGPIHGLFKMQLCSDIACDRPREYPFEYNISEGQ